ncbi:MAG: hypothetical protein NTV52_19835 [Acidobacteria bacterium]|nr:hypothetical protein [Acidobacteriota bacterium]
MHRRRLRVLGGDEGGGRVGDGLADLAGFELGLKFGHAAAGAVVVRRLQALPNPLAPHFPITMKRAVALAIGAALLFVRTVRQVAAVEVEHDYRILSAYTELAMDSGILRVIFRRLPRPPSSPIFMTPGTSSNNRIMVSVETDQISDSVITLKWRSNNWCLGVIVPFTG